jgi:hypothetical protein
MLTRSERLAEIYPFKEPLKVALTVPPLAVLQMASVRASKLETLLMQANLARFKGNDLEADFAMLRIRHAADVASEVA